MPTDHPTGPGDPSEGHAATAEHYDTTDTSAELAGAAYLTKTGTVLTDADLDQLAAEAEAGYDVDLLAARPAGPDPLTHLSPEPVDPDVTLDKVAAAVTLPELVDQVHAHASEVVEHDVDAGAARLASWIRSQPGEEGWERCAQFAAAVAAAEAAGDAAQPVTVFTCGHIAHAVIGGRYEGQQEAGS